MPEEMRPCPKCKSPYGYSLGSEIYACPECGDEWNVNEETETDTIKAVSYTHLDVYKRQPFIRGCAVPRVRNG